MAASTSASSSPLRNHAIPISSTISTTACVYPPILRDKNSTGDDGILYHGPQSPTKQRFHRKPPHLDLQQEYKATKSYRQARETVKVLTAHHRQQQVEKEEGFERQSHADKFTTTFVETRLATCGPPTLNDMRVRIDRQRQRGASTAQHPARLSSPLSSSATSMNRTEQIHKAIRQAYGSQMLDLKSLGLIHIPAQVHSTMLMQLAHMIKSVNVSRNALREIPATFCEAFPDVETLIYKENALDQLPETAMVKLQYLKRLDIACNQLLRVPACLPESLEVLDISRNRLQHLSNLHLLTRLVTLDLSYNHLQLLPPGMMYLIKLRTLALNGNRLVTLAILPKQTVKSTNAVEEKQQDPTEESEGLDDEAVKKLWRVEIDPATNDTIYFHTITKEVTRTKPRCFLVKIPPLPLANMPSSVIESNEPSVKPNNGKVRKKNAFPDCEWEIVMSDDVTSTQLEFVNYQTNESFTTLPPELDTLGDLTALHTLSLSGNQLHELPPSIGKLFRLTLLEAENNHIMMIPDTLQDLRALRVVKLGMNALLTLPPSFMQLHNLTELDLKFNRVQVLPDTFGQLAHLSSLDLSANVLETLPKSFLQLKKLSSLKLQNNPPLLRAGFQADTLARGDIAQVMWQLQHQLECDRRGAKPPDVKSHVIGLGDECWSTNIHLHKEFAQAIITAQTTHVLDFHWKNLVLAQFPRSFFTSLADLRELRISGQELSTLPADFGCVLRSLLILQLRKNKIETMDDNLFTSRDGLESQLEELDIEYNQLVTLPTSVGDLKRLRVLRAANNRMTTLPSELGALSDILMEVHFAHNRFQEPPQCLGSLFRLERLDLSYNKLVTLNSMDFAPLQNLISLRVNVNQLTDLPESISKSSLEELWVAGNAFTVFPSPVLQLKSTLRVLKIQSNKISRLPHAFGELAKLEVIESDGNPFQSPPSEVMAMGIHLIRQYLLKRQERVEEISRLLTAIQLEFDSDAFLQPKLQELLIRPTSSSSSNRSTNMRAMQFLTNQHFIAFNSAVDKYVNGCFYLHPDTRGADLVNKLLLQKHFNLAQRHRANVLSDLLALCVLIRSKKWADKVDFRFNDERPWGRQGELIGVYMLNPTVIYGDDDPADNQSPSLPSILEVIKTRVHHGFTDEAFTHMREDVEDAITNYIGVYGPIGVVHDSVPFKCGCEELLRYNKMHEPCYRPGWTFAQVIYTQEEADRRVADENKITEAMTALRPQIETFLKTPEGDKRFQKEVKALKTKLRSELQALKKKLEKTRKKYKRLHTELQKKVAAEKKLKKSNPMVSLGTEKAKTATNIAVLDDDQTEVQKLSDRVAKWTKEYDHGKVKLGQGYVAFMDDVVSKLLITVGAEVRNHLIQQQRDKAIERGCRRPWDGPGGHDFEAYKKLIRRNLLRDGTMEKEDDNAGSLDTIGDDADRVSVSDNSVISDVSFEGYEDLVSNAAAAANGDFDNDDEDEEDDDDVDTEEEKAMIMANLVVSDVSDDDDEDAKKDESEDSDL